MRSRCNKASSKDGVGLRKRVRKRKKTKKKRLNNSINKETEKKNNEKVKAGRTKKRKERVCLKLE